MDTPLPKTSKFRFPRFSLRALLFVVLCVAIGGSCTTVVVRDAAEKESRIAQAAADELPVRWQELKAAVQRLDPRTQPVCSRFVDTAEQASSGEALRAAMGDPDQPGGSQWTIAAGGGNNRMAVTVSYDGFQLQASFSHVRGNDTSAQVSTRFCPHPLSVGAHPDAFVVAAAVGGMVVGGFCGVLIWGIWCLVRRFWIRFRPAAET